jgi:putative phosphoserine phosphatase/1-acylglycerol-3-phosphate O-acyltransferase
MQPETTLKWLARLARVLTAPFVRLEIRGGACAPRLHNGIIAANHRSLFDVAAGLIALHHFHRYPRLLIAREFVEGRWTAPFCRAIGAIPVDRTAGPGLALAAAEAKLAAGTPILVMPEGRLHWDPDAPLSTGPAKTGVARLAVAAGAVVVPAAVVGSERIWPATSYFPRPNPFRRKQVVVHVADEELVLVGDDHRANTELVMAEIRRLMAEAT